MKNCKQCKKEFKPKDELDMFCSQDCKEEALADLDKDSDECLSCCLLYTSPSPRD